MKAMKVGLAAAAVAAVRPEPTRIVPLVEVPRPAGLGMLRFPEVRKRSGLSRSTLWRMERAGTFPSRRQISRRAVGWVESEIDAWIASRRQLAPAVSR